MPGSVFIFAGGGTGGHLCPALAVAEELVRQWPEARVVFACSNRAIDRRILDDQPYGIVPQPVRPLPRGLRGWMRFTVAYVGSMELARELVGDLKPQAVLGLGGFAAGPVVRRASGAGVPTGLLNPDAVPGRANRFLAGRVDVVFTQFASTAGRFASAAQRKVCCSGCPVRSSLAGGDRQEALRHFDLQPDRRTLLVLGGSLGAASVNRAVAGLAGDLDELAAGWQVLHVAGPVGGASDDTVIRASRALVRRIEYCRRMDLAYAAADVALCRAGASTVAELTATSTPAVLMPYPYHADRHQTLNARPLADCGAGVICEDAKEPAANAESLRRTLLPILRDAVALEAMRAAAAAPAKPRAAETVVGWLITGEMPWRARPNAGGNEKPDRAG